MANLNVQTGTLISNPNPYPDGAVEFLAVATAAAAGSTQGTATALSGVINTVSAASGTNGVILPVATYTGQKVFVLSTAATNALLVYPTTGGAINGGTANASYSVTARKGVEFIALDTAGNWMAIGG